VSALPPVIIALQAIVYFKVSSSPQLPPHLTSPRLLPLLLRSACCCAALPAAAGAHDLAQLPAPPVQHQRGGLCC
jgi:hypothetical protein